MSTNEKVFTAAAIRHLNLPKYDRKYSKDWNELYLQMGNSKVFEKLYGLHAIAKLIECAAQDDEYTPHIVGAAMVMVTELDELPGLVIDVLAENGVVAIVKSDK